MDPGRSPCRLRGAGHDRPAISDATPEIQSTSFAVFERPQPTRLDPIGRAAPWSVGSPDAYRMGFTASCSGMELEPHSRRPPRRVKVQSMRIRSLSRRHENPSGTFTIGQRACVDDPVSRTLPSGTTDAKDFGRITRPDVVTVSLPELCGGVASSVPRGLDRTAWARL